MVEVLRIGGHGVGTGHPCFVIAEAGVNHNGELELARRLVDVAAEAGADAVKFQTFDAERLATATAPKAAYQKETTNTDESQLEMLRRLQLSAAAHGELKAHCARRGILFLSSPFDEECADLLESLDVAAFKIPSGELVNLPFLRHVAGKGRPMIVSTGMATLAEVAAAMTTIREAGAPPVCLLHCVSSYPAPAAACNLRAMATLEQAFRVPVGWSDHTQGIEISLAAVALGAAVVEKHFTLDRSLPGPDHKASLEPGDLAALVRGVRLVQAALGAGIKAPDAAEREVALVARKSLVAARDLAAGSRLERSALVARRPGTGLPPSCIDEVVGKRLRVPVAEGTLLLPEMIED